MSKRREVNFLSIDIGFKMVKDLIKNKNLTGILGLKLEGDTFKLATNCIHDKNYSCSNYQEYYGRYHEKIFPCIESYNDIVSIRNDNTIVKATEKSEFYSVNAYKPESFNEQST